MSDSTAELKPQTEQSEPPSTTAPASARGQSLITRLKAMFAFRTPSLRDDLEVGSLLECSAEVISSNTTEAVDTDLDRHESLLVLKGGSA